MKNPKAFTCPNSAFRFFIQKNNVENLYCRILHTKYVQYYKDIGLGIGTHKECFRNSLLTLDVRLVVSQKAIAVIGEGATSSEQQERVSILFIHARVMIQEVVNYINKEVYIGG